MKSLLIVIFLIIAITCDVKASDSDIQTIAIDTCEHGSVSHIQEIRMGNIVAYDITCIFENETLIYQYTPEQKVFTHFINHNLK